MKIKLTWINSNDIIISITLVLLPVFIHVVCLLLLLYLWSCWQSRQHWGGFFKEHLGERSCLGLLELTELETDLVLDQSWEMFGVVWRFPFQFELRIHNKFGFVKHERLIFLLIKFQSLHHRSLILQQFFLNAEKCNILLLTLPFFNILHLHLSAFLSISLSILNFKHLMCFLNTLPLFLHR